MIDLDPEQLGCEEGLEYSQCRRNLAIDCLWVCRDKKFSAKRLFDQSTFPESWRCLEFPFIWKGERLKLKINRELVSVIDLGASEVEIFVQNNLATVTPGSSKSWNLKKKGGICLN